MMEDQLKGIEAFENQYGYDASYMKAMLRSHPEALAVFNAFLPMATFRVVATPEVYYTAKVTAFQHADCGPCLQLAVNKALEDGVSKELLETILKQPHELNSLLAKVRAFTLAMLSGDSAYEALRVELTQELGEAVIIELALGSAGSQVFPIVKRAMGYHQSCSLVRVSV